MRGELSGQDSSGATAIALVDKAAGAAGRLARTGWRVTRNLPGGARAERELLRLESRIVTGVRARMARDGRLEPVTLVLPANGHIAPLRLAMAELLNRSVNIDGDGAATHLYATILRGLVPDEARILAALADGEPRPAVDVVLRGQFRGGGRTVLANASSVGRAAGVSAPEYVPLYVTRLHRAGVVDLGDEDPDLAEQYDILLTDQLVRDAVTSAKSERGSVRTLRHTVVLSELGKRFWQATDPTIA